ncbi:UNVERIFIED_CONTAM: hypothetical protein PYX00_001593 [Menopon gallinae]|uniref:Serine/threonine-protein phosphatase 4 regulatory subunit 1 n=1 Tax=Menopon gallinae TaxID=328185 RepID=A0AAW2IEL8_9NEOP
MKRLWQVVDEMGRHPDPLIKVILLMQLPKLAMVGEVEDRPYCTQWRLLLEYLVDKDEKVRKSCQLVVLYFLRNQLLDEEIVENHFCPAVDQACALYPDTVDLMCQMVPLVGKEITERYFLQRFIEMCSHLDFTVREVCVRNFSAVCFVVGSETSDSLLLPVFIKLCRDQSVYIRSACVDVFVLVTCLFSMEKRRNELTSTYLDLLMDSSDSCRLAAYRILGAFICTFAEHAVTELLANDRFGEEVSSQNTDSCTSRLLNLLKTENPAEIFSKAYIEQLFPSFAARERIQMNGYEERDNMDNPFGTFSMFDFFVQFEETEPEKGAILEAKHSTFEGLDTSLHDEECNKKDSDEVEQFNSFRFWHIPPMEVDAGAELGDHAIDTEPTQRTWLISECGDSTDLNEKKLDENVSIPLSDQGPDWDMKVSLELVDSVNHWLASDSENDDSVPRSQVVTNPDSPVPRVPGPTQNVVPQILLDHFTSMANNTNVDSYVAQEKAQFCASWLPAVALALGPSNWPFIRDTHKSLSQNFGFKVKRTIASSLHELASMLGEEVTAKDLIPIFEDYLLMGTDDVAMAVFQHLSDFFRHLTPEKRKYLLSRLLGDVLGYHLDMASWRFREEIAEQLKLSIKLFTSSHCLEYFVPVARSLLCDRIASVRHKAVELMSHLIVYVREESNFKTSLMNQLLLEFASHSSWRRRQIFVLLCTHLAVENVLDADIFSALFLNHLLKLSKDFVPNVVLRVAQCLSINIIKNKYINSNNPHFNDVMKILKELEVDKDRDVRYYASLHLQEETDDEKGLSTKSSAESLSTI